MNLFDIVGPVMVGPSSSHTAGAAKIGLISRRLLGERVVDAKIYFHGSFEETGIGHGSDRAIVGGLLGMACDDSRIPHSFAVALEEGLHFTFDSIDLGDIHPNSMKLELVGETGKRLELIGNSIGGGRIRVLEIDGLACKVNGERPTLIVSNDDTLGRIALITNTLAKYKINIATMQLNRDNRGGHAVMVIETDQEVPMDARNELINSEGILKVTYLSTKE